MSLLFCDELSIRRRGAGGAGAWLPHFKDADAASHGALGRASGTATLHSMAKRKMEDCVCSSNPSERVGLRMADSNKEMFIDEMVCGLRFWQLHGLLLYDLLILNDTM